MASDKIFVDLDEEIVFTVENILNSGSDKVIVVIPESANLVASLVSLKLLSRQIAKSDKTIVVVTEDSLGLKLSRKAGLVAKEKISQISPSVWAEALKLKREFLEERKKMKEKLIGERTEANGYEIVDTKKSEKMSVEEKVENKVSDDVPEYTPPLAKKPRLEPKVINLGVVKVLAGGDIEKNLEFIPEIKTEQPSQIPIADDKPIVNAMPEVKTEGETVLAAPTELTAEPQPSSRKVNLIGRDLAALVPETPKPRHSRLRQPSGDKKIGKLFQEIMTKLQRLKASGNLKYKLLALGLVLLLLLYLLTTQVLAGADVTIYVNRTNVSIPDTRVKAQLNITEPDTERYIVPARQIKVSEETSSSADTTGQAKDGENAKGLITLYNKTEQEINLPAGTLVENISTNLKYKTLTATIIPAAVVDGGGNVNLGVKKDISIEAESHGENYNTSGSATYKVAGYTTDQLSAQSFDDVKGGTTSDDKAVSQKDINDLRQGLIDELKNTLQAEIGQLVSQDERLLEGSIKYADPIVTADKKVDEKADSVSMTVVLEATAFVIKNEDLKVIVTEIMKQESDFTGEVDMDKLENPEISEVDVSNNEVSFSVSAEGNITAKLSEEEVIKELTGSSLSDGKKYLDSTEGVESYDISISPFYLIGPFRRFPSEGKIDIDIRVKD